jgi:acyl dehydratase
MRAITSMEELRRLTGQEVVVTDWFVIEQQQVNLFAAATGDRQWIHTDAERSRRESPYGGTVAHGFLSLSLLSMLLEKALIMPAGGMNINYGLNKVRFPAPVPVGSRVRGRFAVMDMEDVAGATQIVWKVEVECEAGDKPACVAEWIVRRYA